jgi:serine protease Do
LATSLLAVLSRKVSFAAMVCVAVLLLVTSTDVRAEGGFSGMYLQGIDQRIATALGLKEPEGVLIRDIALGEAADHAGLERGDLIVGFGGKEVETFKGLVGFAAKTKAGQEVKVDVRRRGRKKSFTMKLGKRPAAWNVTKGEVVAIPETGLTLSSITPKIRQRFNIRWGALGVLVTLIDPDLVNKMPLTRGDIIVQVDQRAVWTPKQIESRYRRAQKDGRVSMLILIERLGEFQFMLLPIKKPS